MPKITLLFASLHVLLMLALAMPVVLHRNTHKIGIGDGGDKRLARKIRVHGNFVEYVPFALLLLGLLELVRTAVGVASGLRHGPAAGAPVARVRVVAQRRLFDRPLHRYRADLAAVAGHGAGRTVAGPALSLQSTGVPNNRSPASPSPGRM